MSNFNINATHPFIDGETPLNAANLNAVVHLARQGGGGGSNNNVLPSFDLSANHPGTSLYVGAVSFVKQDNMRSIKMISGRVNILHSTLGKISIGFSRVPLDANGSMNPVSFYDHAGFVSLLGMEPPGERYYCDYGTRNLTVRAAYMRINNGRTALAFKINLNVMTHHQLQSIQRVSIDDLVVTY